jgi:hypothetical protein
VAQFKLLTAGNPKTEKGEAKGYWTFILHLAPARLSGFQVCPMATEGCKAACLNTAGRGGMIAGQARLTVADIESGTLNHIQTARIRRTRWFFTDRQTFLDGLVADIAKAKKAARKAGFVPVFRLNGTSDIRWESVKVDSLGGLSIFEAFPHTQFYDYTKLPNRKNLPSNYHVTFSLADGNDAQASQALDNGLSVAAVFRDKATVARYEAEGFTLGGLPVPVVNGDESDLRFLDPRGVIVALYAKGNAKTDRSGFVRD